MRSDDGIKELAAAIAEHLREKEKPDPGPSPEEFEFWHMSIHDCKRRLCLSYMKEARECLGMARRLVPEGPGRVALVVALEDTLLSYQHWMRDIDEWEKTAKAG